jgi:transposase
MKQRTRKSRRGKGGAAPPRVGSPLRERIRELGPEHCGILLVDSAKKHFAVRLGNFLGDVLWDAPQVANNRPALERMVEEVERQMAVHGLADLVAGIERTGRWHLPVKAVVERKWPVKMIHPVVTKRLRSPASPGIKTDLADLMAMLHAMMCGYAKDDEGLSEEWQEFRLLSRARRDETNRRSCVRCQCTGRMEALIPGYGGLFEHMWDTPAGPAIIAAYPSAESLARAGCETVWKRLRKQGIRCMRKTVSRVLSWAAQASPADPGAAAGQRLLRDHLKLERHLTELVDDYETALLERLCSTPFVLLLSMTGINVVSSAEFASEMGPDEHYIGARNVNGRAGLFPSRYQSDETDRADGPVARGRNKRLRKAILSIARNLLTNNPYFQAWHQLPEHKGKPYGKVEVAVANRFVRISFAMLRARTVFDHPVAGRQDSVLCKLVAFARTKRVRPESILELAVRALAQLPDDCLDFELRALLSGGWNEHTACPRPSDRACSRGAAPDYVRTLVAKVRERMAAQQENTPTADN